MNPDTLKQYDERSARLLSLLKEAYSLFGTAAGQLRVLLVDDSHAKRQTIIHRLAGLPLQILDFEKGEDALKAFGESIFHAAIVDMTMPGMDGFELCSRLRAAERGNNIPILMDGTEPTEENIIKSKMAGADDFLVKPIHREILIAKLKAGLLKYGIHWPEGRAP